MKKYSFPANLAFFLFFLPVFVFSQQIHDAQQRLRAGIDHFSRGQWPEAVFELRMAQGQAPNQEIRAEALFWTAITHLYSGDYAQALLNMDALEETHPQNRRIRELPYHRGRTLYYLGRFDEAIVLFTGYANSLSPGPGMVLSPVDRNRMASTYFWIAECHFAMGQLTEAEIVFIHVIEEYPNTPKHKAAIYRLALLREKIMNASALERLHALRASAVELERAMLQRGAR